MSVDAGPISAESCRRAATLDSVGPSDLAYACRLTQAALSELVEGHRDRYTVAVGTSELLVCLADSGDYWFPAVHQNVRDCDESGRLDHVGDQTLAELLRSAHDHEFRSDRIRSLVELSKEAAVELTAEKDAILIALDE